MGKAYSVFKKDFRGMFLSPLAYVVIAVFFAFNSLLIIPGMQTADMRGAFGLMATMFIFVIPLLTMRVFSEELRSGTDELLMTSPITLPQIVIGKYLAVVGLIVVILAISLQYVYIIAKFGNPDWGPIATGYIGLFLLGSAFAAFGVFASSLTKNQIVAGVLALIVSLLLVVIEVVSSMVGPKAADILDKIGIINHYYDFDKGVIDSTHIIYYIGFIVLFLFLTVRSLDSRRW